MPKGKNLGLNRGASLKSLPMEQSSANMAIANYRSCRSSSTGSTRTQFLVGTGVLQIHSNGKGTTVAVALPFIRNLQESTRSATG
ncbi:MAG TPA: hypothetical protein VEU98_04525 [Candidatus Eremiobacteraceae bacterium]|nr:hypothetical protein [Candidatus Eremiobacteraceae bacterium]